MSLKSKSAKSSLFAAFIVGQACLAPNAIAQPPHCAQILYCWFNQQAQASDPTSIHKYSENLVARIVQNPAASDALHQIADRLANQLANAEEATRGDNKKLVPEATVAKAFNDLMQDVGAPSSWRATEASIHEFRQHAASVHAFGQIFSADRNGTNCNPGEAVFILSLLLDNNGTLSDQELDRQLALVQTATQQKKLDTGNGLQGHNSASLVRWPAGAQGVLFTYYSHHSRSTVNDLFNHLATSLGI